MSTEHHDRGDSTTPQAAPYSPAGGDILGQHADDRPTRRAPWMLVGGAGVAVLALVGGVTYGVNALSSGGTQPESALPGGAFGYLKVDLDPSAGQKIDGFRYMRKFPALKEKLGNRDDLRELAFEAVAEGAGWDDIDFDSDVAPWMGQRIAVAVYPAPAGSQGSDGLPADPGVVAALQISDEDAAREGLDRLVTDAKDSQGGGSRLGFVVSGDYALLAESQKLADEAARDASSSVLADDKELSADLAAAEDGVFTAWLDTEPLIKALGPEAAGLSGVSGLPGLVGGAGGRSTYVARFDGPDVFEVTGQVVDAETAGWASHPVQGLADLPASSIAALGIADGEELVPQIMTSLEKTLGAADNSSGVDYDEMVTQAEQALGIDLPDDLAVLLGDNLVAAVDANVSDIGARVRTDADRAEGVLDSVEQASGGSLPLVRERAGDDLILASSPEQAARMAEAGTLGGKAGFSDAMPDLADAEVALWVDVKGVYSAFVAGLGGGDGQTVDANVKPIEGLGMTTTSEDDGTASFRMRLVAR